MQQCCNMKVDLLKKNNIRTTDFRLSVVHIFLKYNNAISIETIEFELLYLIKI